MRYQTLGDKPGFVEERIRNDEASANIPKGTPVVLTLDGTEDGLAVVLPSSAGSQALADMFLFGVASDVVEPARLGNATKFGIARQAILRRATRAASTDNWVGSTSIAKGVLLRLDTVNNCFSTAASIVTTATDTVVTISYHHRPNAWLAEDVASFASTASTTGAATALTVFAKAFVRLL